jgi:integrase
VIEQLPCRITLLKVSKGAVSFYDFDEYERLVAAANAIDRRTSVLVLLSGEAGLRSGEMIALEWTDIDLVKRLLCVQRNAWEGQVDSPKGGRIRYVRMTARLTAALREARHLRGPRVLYRESGKPFTEGAVTWAIVRAARRAGLEGNGPHRLRHTFCSHLAMRGAAPRAIQELAGHAHFTTTQRYMHLSPAALDRAIDARNPRCQTVWRHCGDGG